MFKDLLYIRILFTFSRAKLYSIIMRIKSGMEQLIDFNDMVHFKDFIRIIFTISLSRSVEVLILKELLSITTCINNPIQKSQISGTIS